MNDIKSHSDIHLMMLHEWLRLDNYTAILRVASGWIYYRWNDETQDYFPTGTFVIDPTNKHAT